MNLSRVIRCSEQSLEFRSVILSELSGVSESTKGSFVVQENAPPPLAGKGSSDALSVAGVASSANANAGANVADDEIRIDEQELEAQKKKAYNAGRVAGVAEVEGRLGSVTKALAEACSEISSLKSKMLQRSSDDMFRLVMAIAERVIRAEIAAHSEVILRTVQQAIQVAVSAEEFHIKVHPDDLHALQEHKPLFIASLSGLSNIEFVPDPAITAGGCLLESPLGRVDATIETQLDEVGHCLSEAIREG